MLVDGQSHDGKLLLRLFGEEFDQACFVEENVGSFVAPQEFCHGGRGKVGEARPVDKEHGRRDVARMVEGFFRHVLVHKPAKGITEHAADPEGTHARRNLFGMVLRIVDECTDEAEDAVLVQVCCDGGDDVLGKGRPADAMLPSGVAFEYLPMTHQSESMFSRASVKS